MISNIDNMFSLLATRLRAEVDGIYVISKELVDTPPRFPAVSITLSSNTVYDGASTFTQIENAATETIKVEAVSNKEHTKKQEVRKIMHIVDEILLENNYSRIFYSPVTSADVTIYREIGRWRNNILT